MLIGAMNHPARDLYEEIAWMADMGLEFLDLTLEPPAAPSWQVDTVRLRNALERLGLDVIGHTAYYLPIGSPFEEVRQGAVAELKRCLRVFAAVGAKWMNIHPDRHAPFHSRAFFIERDLLSLHELQQVGEEVGVGLMIENLPGDFNDADQLGDLLDRMPELGLHLDIGHCNLMVPKNTSGEILKRYGDRLKHVHLHDNKGGRDDLHMPLGSGNINLEEQVCALKDCSYDGMITLEVFTDDPHYLAYSRDRLREVWDSCPANERSGLSAKVREHHSAHNDSDAKE